MTDDHKNRRLLDSSVAGLTCEATVAAYSRDLGVIGFLASALYRSLTFWRKPSLSRYHENGAVHGKTGASGLAIVNLSHLLSLGFGKASSS